MKINQLDVLIIGSGPAGYTAAIYAARAGLKPVLYEGMQPGGQLTITSDVENYPGYHLGINGTEMMINFKKQAERFGTKIVSGNITKVNFSTYPFNIIANDKDNLLTKSVIISTGASAKWLGLNSEKRLNGKGVSACAVCDGFFYKNQDVAVVGGGDSAAEEAFYLSNICRKVYVLVRRDKMKASKILQNRIQAKDNITILWNTETDEILGKKEVEAVRVLNNKTNKKTEIKIKGFFVAIGHSPNTKIFEGQIDLDSMNYIKTKPDSTQTNIKGVFAAGDVQDRIFRQAITAAGTGCMAALEAEKFLTT